MENLYHIIGGPSRDKLFDAMKHAFDRDKRDDEKYVNFKVVKDSVGHGDTRARMPVTDYTVTSIEHVKNPGHASNSGHVFNISGYCTANYVDADMKRVKFTASYNSRYRLGTIRFIKD